MLPIALHCGVELGVSVIPCKSERYQIGCFKIALESKGCGGTNLDAFKLCGKMQYEFGCMVCDSIIGVVNSWISVSIGAVASFEVRTQHSWG